MRTLTNTPVTFLDAITIDEGIVECAPVEVSEILPPLTRDEENFALAVIECGGNIAAAYRMAYGSDMPFPLARGNELLGKAQVALKIRDITDAVKDAALVSVSAHLHELAEIRDLSKKVGMYKVALNAEIQRASAVGIYQKHDAAIKGKSIGNTQINIVLASPHDANI